MSFKQEDSGLPLSEEQLGSFENPDIRDPEKGSGDDGVNGDRTPPEEQSPSVTDWTGPDDPENPRNWSKWKRRYHVLPPALISFSAYVPYFIPIWPETQLAAVFLSKSLYRL